jgi:hypothetical protein
MIVTNMYYKNEESVTQELKDTTADHFKTDTPKIELSQKQTEKIDTSPLLPSPVLSKKDSVDRKQNSLVEKQEKADTTKVLKKEEKKIETAAIRAEIKKNKEAKISPKEKLFTPVELQRLVNRINTVKAKNKNTANCIQMHITEEGNSRRTIAQIETYLKSNHFTIAGREVVSKKAKGIQIRRVGPCMRITIGSF